MTIDLRKMPSVCDYFVIAGGASTTQVRAIADHIAKRLKEKDERLWHIEGEREALWILLDFGDIVVHVFQDQTRRYYDLEKLWSDAPQHPYKEKVPVKKKAAPGKKRRKIRAGRRKSSR